MPTITSQRLANQRLASPEHLSPAAVVRWLVGLQAQDYAGALWSIGLRLAAGDQAVVEEALSRQEFVRTWAMRGTLHLVAAADVHWLLSLLAPRIISGNARRYRQLELDEGTLAYSSDILAEALSGGQRLDRHDLAGALHAQGITTAGQRLVYMLQYASLTGRICQTIAVKNQPLYTTLPPAPAGMKELPREEALAELARRYFTSRGPATRGDFVWWSGLAAGDAQVGITAAKAHLQISEDRDQQGWQGPPTAIPEIPPAAILLPAFDEYLVSYRERSAAIPAAFMEAWSQHKAMFRPSLIINGRVAGLWKRRLSKTSVHIAVQRLRKLSEVETTALELAAERYANFLGKTAVLQ